MDAAVHALQQALALDPNDPHALMYVALPMASCPPLLHLDWA